MKRILASLLLVAVLLCGCAGQKKFQITYLDLFDTVTVITAYSQTQGDFSSLAQQIHDNLLEYHQLFDIYNDYEGIVNLKTVNENAGIAPVAVDERIIALLLDCRAYYELTGGRVNVAMGSVLGLWHDTRSAALDAPDNASLPDITALQEASLHISWETVIIDEANGTVYLSDPAQRLDVGAIAKGWALQRVAEELPSGILINLGGNVCATGPKGEDGTPWTVGVNDPDDGSAYVCTVALTLGSVVTSGDYQRYYTVDGVNYHHIIDPDTLFPAEYWSSVTILCSDSGLADALSTALFLLPQAEGQALLDVANAEAMWIDREGNCLFSDGFSDQIRQ